MTLEESRDLLAVAITKAASEHGRPNSFSPRELRLHYGGPDQKVAGRIGRRYIVSLWRALGGREKWGSCPVYAADTRRFYI